MTRTIEKDKAVGQNHKDNFIWVVAVFVKGLVTYLNREFGINATQNWLQLVGKAKLYKSEVSNSLYKCK